MRRFRVLAMASLLAAFGCATRTPDLATWDLVLRVDGGASLFNPVVYEACPDGTSTGKPILLAPADKVAAKRTELELSSQLASRYLRIDIVSFGRTPVVRFTNTGTQAFFIDPDGLLLWVVQRSNGPIMPLSGVAVFYRPEPYEQVPPNTLLAPGTPVETATAPVDLTNLTPGPIRVRCYYGYAAVGDTFLQIGSPTIVYQVAEADVPRPPAPVSPPQKKPLAWDADP